MCGHNPICPKFAAKRKLVGYQFVREKTIIFQDFSRNFFLSRRTQDQTKRSWSLVPKLNGPSFYVTNNLTQMFQKF